MNKKRSFRFDFKTYGNIVVILAALVVMILLNQFGVLGKGNRSTLVRIGFGMILAVSLNLVVGFLGELSLGHAGFMCVGAFLGALVTNLLKDSLGNGLLSIVLAMLIGGTAAAICGLLVGIPALRLQGDYLAICTLAFGEIIRNIIKNLDVFGGPKGIATGLYDSNTLFIVTFSVLIVMIFLIENLIHSKHGRAITAIRDNEIAARTMGINVTFYKLFVFVLAAFFAGIAGVLYAKSFGTVRQENFDYNYSIEILVMVVLGGIGSVNGSLIAAAIITFLNILLQNSLSGSLAPLKLIIYGLVLILMILYNNAPAFAKLREKLNFKKLFHRTEGGGAAVRDPEEN